MYKIVLFLSVVDDAFRRKASIVTESKLSTGNMEFLYLQIGRGLLDAAIISAQSVLLVLL